MMHLIAQASEPWDSSPEKPQVVLGTMDISGATLSRASIEESVGKRRVSMRTCYARGLKVLPGLAGTVAVHFVIGRDGAVSQVDSKSTLPDKAVVKCVTSSFYGLQFPQPEGGIVSVVCPVALSPPRGPHAR